jgi:hypothetical protein
MKIVISESQYNKILKEEEEQGYYEKNFIKILKKFIPDNSVIEFSFPLPYADQGQVDVQIEMSISPRTKLHKIEDYGYAPEIFIDIHNAMWKGPEESFHPMSDYDINSTNILRRLVKSVDEKIWEGLPLINKEYVIVTSDRERRVRI